MKYKRLIEPVLIVVAVFLIFTLNSLEQKARHHENFLVPPQGLKFFTLGYSEVLADFLWIRLLQDVDYCGAAATVNPKGSGISQEEFDKQLNQLSDHSQVQVHEGNEAKCENGWSAHMLDAITELAPKFKMPYTVGATILSGIVKDNVGSAKIFKKGVERFPDDWQMTYRAAYHYMAAMSDFATAADYLQRAGRKGAPRWVFALAARLQTKLGQAVLAKPVLEEAIAADPTSEWAKELQKRLEEINKIIKNGE